MRQEGAQRGQLRPSLLAGLLIVLACIVVFRNSLHNTFALDDYYRVVDNGTRCVRDPCFSFTARSVNASTRVTVSTVDLEAAGASASARQRVQAALATKDGLYARGRFTRTPDGGTVFRSLRLFLRAPLPRA